ncbi:hypothetical protein CVT24_006348 [Panaeolus cyanescens]|uniref:Cytochrome P450 n=1 Tax=Panaeolus cyanescens TaxID=181874 RepID=A0A409YEA5_9AGAR|nr:hypothetical protein CVT24_006348 [Panaeolus cyanescens]
MRWHQVVPFAIAHMTSEDNEYDGYFIPKGTTVIGNSWAILHDESLFENPFAFNPERYYNNPNITKPDVQFGYGRRACPGRYFADRNLFAIVSATLAVFDILPPLDDRGRPVQLDLNPTESGIVSDSASATKILLAYLRSQMRSTHAFLIVGGLTAATLFSSYFFRLQHKKKEQAAGLNPMHEQVLSIMARKPIPGEDLEEIRWKYSQTPPAFPATEHHSGHAIRDHARWKKTPQFEEIGEGVMYMEPTPQRGRKDSDKPYTKSPDYAANYNKTRRPKAASKADDSKLDSETGVPSGAPAPATMT